MQVGNCFVPRRGSGDNARYARVSCEETLETCERIRSNVVWNDRSAVGLLSLPRCRTRTGGTGAGTPRRRAPTRLIVRGQTWALTVNRESGPIIVNARSTPTHPPICNYSRNYSGIRSGSPTLTHHSINRHRTPLSRVGPSPGDHLVSALPSGCGLVICIISDVSTHASRTRMSHGINRWDSSLHK